MKRVIRSSILLFGALATVLALKVQSVQALWFFTSDLVFVLLFPQLLVRTLRPESQSHRLDRRVRRIARPAAWAAESRCSACRRSFRIPSVPFRTLAAAAGLVLLPLVVARDGAMGCARAAAQRERDSPEAA